MFVNKFGKVITAMITPFTEDGAKIDYKQLEVLIKHLQANNTSALLITGTTGENPTLTHEEEYDLLKKVQDITQGKMPIVFGAGSNSTHTAMLASKKAEELGADAIMTVSPYYNKPNQEGIYAHFAATARELKTPILLYNNPGRTASYIEPQTIAQLVKDFPVIQAIKESGSPQAFDTITYLKRENININIYIGDDPLLLPALSLGCEGVVSVASHIVGQQMAEIINLFSQGKNSEALELYNKIYPIFKVLFSAPSPSPTKYLLASKLNIGTEAVRLPLTPVPVEVKALCEAVYSQIIG